MSRSCFLLTAIFLLSVVGCESANDGSAMFYQVRQQLMRGEFAEADKQFTQFQSDHPTHSFASRAAFLQAKAQLGLGNLQQAEECFQETIRKHPQSEEAHKSRYKLALIALLRGQRGDAAAKFQQIVDRRSGTLVPEAAAMLRMLQMEKKQPLPAVPDES